MERPVVLRPHEKAKRQSAWCPLSQPPQGGFVEVQVNYTFQFAPLFQTRLQGVIDKVLPIFKAKGLNTINPNLRASNIATNRFIDPKIGLPKKGCAKNK